MPGAGREKGHRDPKGSQREPIDAKIARIASAQFGLITIVQLLALGLTYTEVRGRVRKGRLFPVHRGVYAVGRPDISPRGHLKAGLLALGDASFLTHRSSLAVQGLRAIDLRNIELTLVAERTPKRPGLIIHRTSTHPHRHEIRSRFGLRYSSLARALIEVAPRESIEELNRLITAGIHKNLVDFKALQETIARHEGQPGVGKLRLLTARYLDSTDRESWLERSFDKVIGADPRFPSYEKNVRVGGYEWDVVFRRERLVVELDGRPYHVALQDMEKDRAKDTWAQLHGMRIMRITDLMWDYERAQAIENMLKLLALGGWVSAAA